ncbi:MAG: hypothetical protein GY715_22040 [Planctomycetes bacterium]|nr:hypothetical protein [Planctomycetota bacterium]
MTNSKLNAFTLAAALAFATAASAADPGVASQDPDLGNLTGTEEATPSAAECSMDYDNSGTIDFGDFLHVMSNWGARSNLLTGDALPTGDAGGYGFADLIEVINNYGRSCKPAIG